MPEPIKHMDIQEFVEQGFLQEANRMFFHPLGLALEVTHDDEGEWYLSGVWDYREDPEGMMFGDLTSMESLAKAEHVANERAKHAARRTRRFSSNSPIQPIGDKQELPDEE